VSVSNFPGGLRELRNRVLTYPSAGEGIQMRHESVTDDGHVVLEEECGCAASNGFFKTCERHDDLKTLSEMKAYLALRKSLLKAGAEAQEKFKQGSRDRYNKRARLRERTKAPSKPPNISIGSCPESAVDTGMRLGETETQAH